MGAGSPAVVAVVVPTPPDPLALPPLLVLRAPVDPLRLTEPEGVAEVPLPTREVEAVATDVGVFEGTCPAPPWVSGGTEGSEVALSVAGVSVGISLG